AQTEFHGAMIAHWPRALASRTGVAHWPSRTGHRALAKACGRLACAIPPCRHEHGCAARGAERAVVGRHARAGAAPLAGLRFSADGSIGLVTMAGNSGSQVFEETAE